MTTFSVPTKYTPQEVARLSDQDGKLYELVGGNLVEKPRAGIRTTWTAGQISFRLNRAYPPSQAFVFLGQPTYCFSDGEMRRPDVALVWSERLPEGLTDDELYVAPDLVVEVVSPPNRFNAQLDRVAEYLDAGVPIVCVAQPARRWIHVYRKDGTVSLLRAADTLKDEPLLPGLALPVADCFPAVPAQKVGT